MAVIEARLAELGMVLPATAKVPPGVTLLFPWVNVRPGRAFVSGHAGLESDGSLAGPFCKVGAEVDLAAARGVAGKTAMAMLASLRDAAFGIAVEIESEVLLRQ
jgi:hypothetical protein